MTVHVIRSVLDWSFFLTLNLLMIQVSLFVKCQLSFLVSGLSMMWPVDLQLTSTDRSLKHCDLIDLRPHVKHSCAYCFHWISNLLLGCVTPYILSRGRSYRNSNQVAY